VKHYERSRKKKRNKTTNRKKIRIKTGRKGEWTWTSRQRERNWDNGLSNQNNASSQGAGKTNIGAKWDRHEEMFGSKSKNRAPGEGNTTARENVRRDEDRRLTVRNGT